tara:strand:+ start:1258 stop:1566 length:309 start_codon:yes stop_codon:yes gene_type:complete
MAVDEAGPGLLNHVDNISANGVLCHTIRPVPLMTKMRIALDLPAPYDCRVDAEGVVVRCDAHDQGDDHFKVAILFTKIKPHEHESVRQFVEEDIAVQDGVTD